MDVDHGMTANLENGVVLGEKGELYTLVISGEDELKLLQKAFDKLQSTPGILVLRRNDEHFILIFECNFLKTPKKDYAKEYPINPKSAEWGYTDGAGPKISIT